jgi:uncharacterized protein (DUF2235 family)
MAKNIVFCSDGTGNTTVKNRGTNVFKLFEAVDVNGHRADLALRRQLAYYDDGVGTENLRWIRVFAGATGYGLSRNVKQIYRELCRVYEAGDCIYLFGFSRGAFTVRTLSGLVNDCGILNASDYSTEAKFRRQVREAYKAYRRKYSAWFTQLVSGNRGMKAPEFKERFALRDATGKVIEPCISLLGVWDTVDAVGLPFALADLWNKVVWQYKFETTSISDIVQKGCHALALDDERAEFEPVLWDEGGPKKKNIEQVWFAGAHSNVGGGYPQQGMSLVALDWMMDHAEQAGLRFVPHLREEYTTEHSFADRLYEPRAGLGMFYRWKPRNPLQLCQRKGIAVPKIHVSALERLVQAPEGYAPGNLPPRCEIVITEPEAYVRVDDVAKALANAHGGPTTPPLVERQRVWVRVGLAGYVVFVLTFLTTAARVIMLAMSRAEVSATDGNSIATVAILTSGLVAGYVLGSLSDNRISNSYSSFWHKHRVALREALSRTPAPSAKIREGV